MSNNLVTMKGDTAEIWFGSEKIIIDGEDLERCSRHTWKVMGKNRRYAATKIKGKTVQLHRFILGLKSKDTLIDHRDRNPLNNRKDNLRKCTKAQNGWNAGAKRSNKIGLKGITLIEKSNIFVVRISVNRKQVYLGSFKDILDAIKAYNQGSEKYHGEFGFKHDLLTQNQLLCH